VAPLQGQATQEENKGKETGQGPQRASFGYWGEKGGKGGSVCFPYVSDFSRGEEKNRKEEGKREFRGTEGGEKKKEKKGGQTFPSPPLRTDARVVPGKGKKEGEELAVACPAREKTERKREGRESTKGPKLPIALKRREKKEKQAES